MTTFITSIAQLSLYVENGPTDGVDFARLLPTIRKVEREFVAPLFPAVWLERWRDETLLTQLNETESTIRDLLCEAVGHLATWKYAKTAAVLLTGSGMQKMENEHFSSAYKDDKQEFKADHEADGLAALEAALREAVLYHADLQGFIITDAYENATARLVNFTKDFAQSRYLVSYKTFQTLLPIIELIERETVIPLLSSTFYAALKTEQYDPSVSDEKRTLLRYLREGIGQYAIAIATEMNLITLEGNQVFTREWKNNNDLENRTAPRKDLYEVALKTREAFAFRYFKAANQFLNDNATALVWTAPPPRVAYKSTRIEIGLKSL